MLVLERKPREVIIIRVCGKTIRVTVNSISRNAVRIGFEADSDVLIDREEVYESKQQGAKK